MGAPNFKSYNLLPPPAPTLAKGAKAVLGNRDCSFSKPKSEYQRRETKRREKILADYDRLRGIGCPHSIAVKQLGVGGASIWRWKQRIEPTTDRCGRRSEFVSFPLSIELIGKVKRFRQAGLTELHAWQAAVSGEDSLLARYIRALKAVTPAMKEALK